MMTRAEVLAAYPNLQGLDLSGANLSGTNLSGANLYKAYLSGANLSRANLSGANLIDVKLRNAKGAIDLGTDPRGYYFIAVAHLDGWRIKAGCRWFTVDEALAHWAQNPDALARVGIALAHVRMGT